MNAARIHWRHYAIEGWALGTFMIVAAAVAIAFTHLPDPLGRWFAAHGLAARALIGSVMASTAIAIVYSPWGARSGAHLNPAVSLTFALLGKLRAQDAAGYVLAQFAGGALGLAIAAAVAGRLLLDPPVHAIVTQPGPAGPIVAFLAELLISGILMTAILVVSNGGPRVARFTGVAASILVATFITFEAPLSGTSMNPARSFASALAGHDYTALWIYFIAPPAGMLLAAAAFVRARGWSGVACGRLNHTGPYPCIFRCSYGATPEKPRS